MQSLKEATIQAIEEADDVRISAVRHSEQIYRPWFEGKRRYPKWESIIDWISTEVKGRLGGLLLWVQNDMAQALVTMYDHLRAMEDKRNA